MLFPPLRVPGWWDVDADGVAKPPGDPRMKEICHPNCVRLYAVFDEEHQNGKIYAVMELFGSCPAPVARWFIPWFIPLFIGKPTIPGGVGFLPSTVWLDLWWLEGGVGFLPSTVWLDLWWLERLSYLSPLDRSNIFNITYIDMIYLFVWAFVYIYI